MPKKLDHQDVVARIAQTSPNVIVESEYITNHGPLLVRCRNCDRSWKTTPVKLFKGRGCRICKRKPHNRISYEAFLERLPMLIPSVTILGEYKGWHEPLLVKCDECNNEWETWPRRLSEGHRCTPCSKKYGGLKQRIPIDRIRELMDPNIEIIGAYEGRYRPIDVRCKVCGHEWSPLCGNLVKNNPKHKPRTGCPKCEDIRSAENRRLSQNEVIERLNVVSPKIEVLGNYRNAHADLEVECRECGYHWMARPAHLLKGGGCPACAGYGFQPDKPASFYYLKIRNPFGLPLYKIGVTNFDIERRFRKDDYAQIDEQILVAKFAKGINAYKFEQALMKGFSRFAYEGPVIF